MYRERALFKFQRYYLHEIRDGKDSDTASSIALWKAREEILSEVTSDPDFKTDVQREEAWADILVNLMIFKMLLIKIPIDRTKLKPGSRIDVNPDTNRPVIPEVYELDKTDPPVEIGKAIETEVKAADTKKNNGGKNAS